MSKATKVYELLYNLSRAAEIIEDMTPSELNELRRFQKLESNVEPKEVSGQLNLWTDLIFDSNGSKHAFFPDRPARRRPADKFEDFGLPKVMQRVKSLVMNSPSIGGVTEITWLLRILLISPKVFASIRELENFLTNITAITHNTKNTGRDRIVDWYFKRLDEFPQSMREEYIMSIARHLFVSLPSNYAEWHALLLEDAE